MLLLQRGQTEKNNGELKRTCDIFQVPADLCFKGDFATQACLMNLILLPRCWSTSLVFACPVLSLHAVWESLRLVHTIDTCQVWQYKLILWLQTLASAARWQRRGPTRSHRTCGGDVARRRLPDFLGVITNPLLAALPCHLNQLRVWAPDKGRTWVCAHGNTAHSPINARAVVLAVGLKCVPVVIPDSIEDTPYTDNLWKEGKRKTHRVPLK